LAIDGSSGTSRGHGSVMRRPGSQRNGVIERPSAFQAGHIPSWHRSCECYALWPVAAVSGWLLLLLSPLLSAAGRVPHLRGVSGAVTAPCASQTPPPNPIAADPDGRRVLSGGGAADHEVTPQAPLTGSGCREYSYGGFGGGHPHFLPHAPNLVIDCDVRAVGSAGRRFGRRLSVFLGSGAAVIVLRSRPGFSREVIARKARRSVQSRPPVAHDALPHRRIELCNAGAQVPWAPFACPFPGSVTLLGKDRIGDQDVISASYLPVISHGSGPTGSP